MRIFLVMPRTLNPKQTYREYPLGLGYLGTLLAQAGHDVTIHDQLVEGTDTVGLVAAAEAYGPDVVGLSVITPNYPNVPSIIQSLRERIPGLPIMAGGVHASLFPADLIRDGADAVLAGEGESVIVALAEALAQRLPLAHIPGLTYLDPERGIVQSNARPAPTGPEHLPMVDRSLFNLPRYQHHSLLASRGCPYKCTFCCNYSGTILSKGLSVQPYQRVIKELLEIQNRFGSKEVFFADDIFLVKRSNILQFCDAYKEARLDLNWVGQTRVDTVTDELTAKMAEAGCKRIYFGVESGSEAILERTRKKVTVDNIRKSISATKRAGVRVKTGWIYGLPGTLEEQRLSIDLMLETRPNDISIHQLIPFPGTEYYNNPSAHGIRIKNPKDFASFCYGGLGDNISFDYMSREQYRDLLVETVDRLEAAGYVSSDVAQPGAEYIYTTPLSSRSIRVFNSGRASTGEV